MHSKKKSSPPSISPTISQHHLIYAASNPRESSFISLIAAQKDSCTLHRAGQFIIGRETMAGINIGGTGVSQVAQLYQRFVKRERGGTLSPRDDMIITVGERGLTACTFINVAEVTNDQRGFLRPRCEHTLGRAGTDGGGPGANVRLSPHGGGSHLDQRLHGRLPRHAQGSPEKGQLGEKWANEARRDGNPR